MKVLFVSSGNSKFGVNPIVKRQGDDLIANGVNVDFFLVKGKGIRGYLSNIKKLRRQIKKNNYDFIHAHYVLNAWVTLLSFTRKRIVLSLMGSDTFGIRNRKGRKKLISYILITLTILIQPFVSKIIVKSNKFKKKIFFKKKCFVIPNGVDISIFKEKDKAICANIVDIDINKKNILFLGNKDIQTKNFSLLKNAIEVINSETLYIIEPYPVEHSLIPAYLNSVDVLVLTSFSEGSPNVIKEAMACNCPIVCTNVGDVKDVIGDTEGCFICSFEPNDFAGKIKMALDFAQAKGRTNGRNRIRELRLDSESVANRVVEIYGKVIADKQQ